MIKGVVQSDEARIKVTVKGAKRRQHVVDAIVDTGYTASLTLPPALIASLGLKWRSVNRGTLADGSQCLLDVYEARIVWDGAERRILVDEADIDPLLGMRFFKGYELCLQVRSGGSVTIKRLRGKAVP